MRAWRRYVVLGAGLALGTAALSMTSAGPALAQGALKPLAALIVNDASNPVPVAVVGQPVRQPYSFDDVGQCNTANCFFDYPTVPAGKRLVVLHVNGIARANAPPVFDQAELVSSNTENALGARHTFGLTQIGRAGSSNVLDTWGFNSPVLAFVESGQSPRVTIHTSVGMTAGAFVFSQVTVSGYLEDAP
jgi:hypothetical protein